MSRPNLARLAILGHRLPGETWREYLRDVLWPPNLAGSIGHAIGVHNDRACRGRNCAPVLRRPR